MLRARLIPVLLLKNGLLVRSEAFRIHQIIGNPIYEVKRFNDWNVDELIYLDITREGEYDTRREDHKTKSLSSPLEILEEVAKTCFMPLAWGGKIRTFDQAKEILSKGADKITLNTGALQNPGLISQIAKSFGSQAVVVSIDVLTQPNGEQEVYAEGGTLGTGQSPCDWAKQAQDAGAGEILLQSINRDGSGEGYDVGLI